jgi:hypothetical protein
MSDKTLNEIMEFDHVIVVHEDGSITDAPNERKYWAPELLDQELDSSDWEFFSAGYTGQDSYSGPIMDDSEFIAGQLERDIRETPGVYTAVISYYSSTCDTCHEPFIDTDNSVAHQNYKHDDDHYATDDELYIEGWAVVKLKEKEVTA